MQPLISSPAASSWLSVAAVGIGAFALVTTEFLPVGLLPQVARELTITEGQTGLMVTLPGLLAALTAPLTLLWARTLDRRRVLCVLLALLAVSNVTVALASNLWMLLLGRALLGIAVGGFWTIGGTLGPRLRPEQAAKATSLIFSGVSIGTVAGVPAGTLLGEWLGWRVVFAVAAGLSLIVTLLLWRNLPRLPAQPGTGLGLLADVLRLRKTRFGLLAVLLIFIGQFAAYTYLSPYLLNEAAMSPVSLSAILLGFGIAGFIGNLAGGWAITRSPSWTLKGTALLMGIPMILLAGVAPIAPAVVMLVMLWGVGFGLLPIAMQSWLFAMAPERLEAMGAIFVSSAQVSIGIGALAGGLVVDHFGVLSALILGGTSAVLTAIVILISRFKTVSDMQWNAEG
ncbi:MFS transporter [Pseudomonas putida]|uniref:MFS transporter n=1 Tax=Pseudomonas putida TaxID=303 RepID=UPI001F07C888|nr:MFS transporter [Pseudomonas putida]